MISVNRIKYAGYSSQDFDLICDLSFDSDDGETSTYLSREAVASETYRGDFKRVSSYKYSEVLAPTITFIDKDFGEFDFERHRKILKWLTSKDTASFMTVYHDDSHVVSYEILGAFIDIQTYKNGNGRVIGIVATFESISPWAFSPLQTILEKDVSDPDDNKITINLETDDSTPVYPRITIKQNSDTNIIQIDSGMVEDDERWVEGSVFQHENTYYWIGSDGVKYNESDNTSDIETTSVYIANIYTDGKGNISEFNTLVKRNIKGERVVLDGANRVVSSFIIDDSGKETINNKIFGDNFDFNWIPLYEGRNELSFIGNCVVTIEYRYPIKCGEY